MKQLVCEMCGSTDFLKQDGLFVCQTCGLKYTLEEARNMMTDVPANNAPAPVPAEQPKNNQQIENILTMARSAYESNNYAKAEEFCDQIIAIDNRCYEAWKIKGEAINYQINVNNQRILEAYNCLMSAFRTLDLNAEDPDIRLDAEEKKNELIASLNVCLEGEVDFWLNQVEAGRPTNEAVQKAENTFYDCYNKLQAAYIEMGVSKEETELKMKEFDNHFVGKANAICNAAWKSTVGYNYYRGDFSNLGARWNRTRGKNEFVNTDNVFRPNENIRTTFLKECDNLASLLKFCVKQFNDLTSPKQKEAIYGNIAYFILAPKDQVSYKAMVSTTTNGYGAVVSRSQYYAIDYYLTDSAKASRSNDAAHYQSLKEATIREGKEKEEAARKKRIADYWNDHPEEKDALETERTELIRKMGDIDHAITMHPLLAEIAKLKEKIDALQAEKKAISLFKGKERKAVQDQIDEIDAKVGQLDAEKNQQIEKLRADKNKLCERVDQITLELNKDR